MDDSAICLPWDKNFGLTPLEQTEVYGGLWKILLKNLQDSSRDILVCQYPLGQTLEKLSRSI